MKLQFFVISVFFVVASSAVALYGCLLARISLA